MIRYIRFALLSFISALMITVAASLPVQAGTMTIYNKNCTKTSNFSTKKRVSLHVYSSTIFSDCTNIKVTVHQGHTKTVELVEQVLDGGDWWSCEKYAHEAMGTVFGGWDVRGDRDTSVTCKKDWLGVCQCDKD